MRPHLHHFIDYNTKPVGPMYKDLIFRASPKAYFRMQATAGTTETDQSGNGKNGTYSGSTYTLNQTTCPLSSVESTDRSVRFNGSSCKLAFAGFGLPRNVFSLEFWINIQAFPGAGSNHSIFYMETGQSNGLLFAYIDELGRLGFFWTGGAFLSTARSLSTWYHVVYVIRADGTTEGYINGTVFQTYQSQGRSLAQVPTASWAFGATAIGSLNSYLDELAVYDYDLSAEEIADHYAARLQGPLTATSYIYATSWLRDQITIQRGRQQEIGSIEPSTAQVILENKDRTWEPGYSGSEIYPLVKVRLLNYLFCRYPGNLGPDNSSFEAGGLSGWTTSGQVASAVSGSGAFHGSWRAQSSTTAAGNTDLISTDYIYVDRTRPHTLSAYFRAYGGTNWADANSGIWVQCYDSAFVQLANAGPTAAATGIQLPASYLSFDPIAAWGRWGGVIPANSLPAGTIYVRIRVRINGNTNAGVDLDAVELNEGTEPATRDSYTEPRLYNLFTGYNNDIVAVNDFFNPKVEWPMVDFFSLLSEKEIENLSFDYQLVGTRIKRLLKMGGWNGDTSKIDAGYNNCMAEEEVSGSLGELISNVALMDWGRFFIDDTGTPVFHDADHHLSDSRQTTSQGTFADKDDGTSILMTDLTWDYGIRSVVNEVSMSRPGGVTQVAKSEPSIKEYGPQTYSETAPFDSDITANNRATDLVTGYSVPIIRFRELKVEPLAQPTEVRRHTAWALVLALELGDRVTVKTTPSGVGSTITRTCYIEATKMEISLETGNWVFTFGLRMT